MRASTTQVLAEVGKERERQDGLWGEQNHEAFKWLSILIEEVGEVARAINEGHWNGADWQDYRKELLHVAGVAVGAAESFDRNQGHGNQPHVKPAPKHVGIFRCTHCDLKMVVEYHGDGPYEHTCPNCNSVVTFLWEGGSQP